MFALQTGIIGVPFFKSAFSDCMTWRISGLKRLSQAVVHRRKQTSTFPTSKVLTGERERKDTIQLNKST